MKRVALILLVAFLSTTIFADGIIGPQLQKALESERAGQLHIIVTLKKDVNANKIIATNMIRGTKADIRTQVNDNLKRQCENSQHFLSALCNKMVNEGRAINITKFWLANAIALTASADAIQELALQADVHSISLDQEQIMIHPVAAKIQERSLWGLDHIRSKAANDNGITGKGITVAVLDTGIDLDHSAFEPGQILTAKCKSFVPSEPSADDGHGHGTHCAGTIGSFMYGVAPGVKLVGVKVLSSGGSGSWTGVMQGVEYASQIGVDIASMSLGGTASSGGNVVETAVKNAIASGVTLVIAAGNSGPWTNTIGTPGVVKEAITVGAIDSGARLAYFSSRGKTVYGDDKPDIVAPGVNVLSAWKNGGTNTISGTSMATPHVAGLCALVLGKFKGSKPKSIKGALMATAKGTKKANEYGEGCVDALNATAKSPSVLADTVFLANDRGSKSFTATIDANGNCNINKTLSAPISVTLKGFKCSSSFGNANIMLNGRTLYNGPVNGGQKYGAKAKINSGSNSVSVKATGGTPGTVTVTVEYSIW